MKRIKNKNKNLGVTLLELMLVLGIVTAMVVQDVQQKVREADQAAARNMGNELFIYSNALRKYVNENYQSLIATIPNNGTAAYNGVNFLKHTSCGGGASATESFLPCTFPAATSLGSIPFNAVFRRTGNSIIVSRDFGPVRVGGEERSDLAGLAALTAAGISLNDGNVAATTTAQFTTDPTGTSMPRAMIRMEINSSTAGSGNAWLRTDGSNDMLADISFDGSLPSTVRGIVNVARLRNVNNNTGNDQIDFESALRFTSTATSTRRRIENLDGVSNGYGDVNVYDNLDVHGTTDLRGTVYDSNSNLYIADNVNVSGYLYDSGSNLYLNDNVDVQGYLRDPSGNLYVNDNLDVEGYLRDPNGDLRVNDNLDVYGTLDTWNYIRNPSSNNSGRVYIADNVQISGYLTDPWSNFEIYDNLDLTGYIRDINSNVIINDNLEVYGTTYMNDLYTSRIWTQIMYDSNNGNYFVDPHSTSRMNNVETIVLRGHAAYSPNDMRLYENNIHFWPEGYDRQYWHGRVDTRYLQTYVTDYWGNRTSTYRQLIDFLPRFTHKGMWYVYHGNLVRKPGCYNGSPKIVVVPNNVPIMTNHPWCDSSNGVYSGWVECYRSRGQLFAFARHYNSAYWRVYIYTWPYSALGWGVANTYCQNY